MSLVRAFTTRGEPRPPANIHLGRAASHRNGRPVYRSQISGPVALVSSTNALSYDAPDIVSIKSTGARNFSSSSSTSAGEESDTPSLSFDNASHTDTSSINDFPATPGPEPNHLSCYFKPAVDTMTTHSASPGVSRASSFDAPSLPQRVPSHSKKAHEFVHRKRSIQRMMSPPASLVRTSMEMFAPYDGPAEAPKENPFGNELAQLDEVAEELSHAVRDAEKDEDRAYMDANDLACFGASDYLDDIGKLLSTYLANEAAWI